MDVLWAPWRLQYIVQARDSQDRGCFICAAIAGSDDRANLVVFRSRLAVVMLNKYPYNNGHLLVAPQAHKGDPTELTDEEVLDVMRALHRMLDVLRRRLAPDGFNVGLNLGRVAGAGLPDHLHWHVVPRWQGDTNFMPVVADTKVISQSLEALYELLAEELSQLLGPSDQQSEQRR